MFYLLNRIVEPVSGFIVLLPATVLFHAIALKKDKKDGLKAAIAHMIAAYIFGFILLSMLSVTGIPNAYSLRVEMNISLIPFIDVLTNYVQYIQNIILFMPFGFLLPMLWKKFEKKRLTLIAGLSFSLMIEVIQIFSFRVTDIDDLLMNTIGTAAGYYAFISIKRIFPKISIFSINNEAKYWKREPYFLFSLAWAVMFFIQPLISSLLWGFVFRSRSFN